MDRRAFIAAFGGILAVTVAKAQTATPGFPIVGDALNAGNNLVGAGLAAPGQILQGGLGASADLLGGGAVVPGGQFRLVDLMGGDYSIETSRLALQKSRNPQIRNFAQLEINEQVSVAAALGATPGSVPPRPDQTAIIQRLAAMPSGPAFDRAYVDAQIKGHDELLANNNQAVHSPADPAIRRVATLSIPTIQTHLAILQRLHAGLPAV